MTAWLRDHQYLAAWLTFCAVLLIVALLGVAA